MSLYSIYDSTMSILNDVLWSITFNTLGGELGYVLFEYSATGEAFHTFLSFVKFRLFMIFILVVFVNFFIMLIYTKIFKTEYSNKLVLKNTNLFILFSCFFGEILLSLMVLVPVFMVLYVYIQNFKKCIKMLKIPLLILSTIFCFYFISFIDSEYQHILKRTDNFYFKDIYNPLYLK